MILQSVDNLIEGRVLALILLLPFIAELASLSGELVLEVEGSAITLSLAPSSGSVVHWRLHEGEIQILRSVGELHLVGLEVEIHFNEVNHGVSFLWILCNFCSLHGNYEAVKIVDLPVHLTVPHEYLVRPATLVQCLQRSGWFRKAHLGWLVKLNEDLAVDVGLADVLLASFNIMEQVEANIRILIDIEARDISFL